MTMRVLMVGTSLDAPGGVASVLRTWREAGLFERMGVHYVATNAGSGAAAKLGSALRAWGACAAAMLLGRAELVHVHTSSFSSFWRKTPVLACALLTGRRLVVSLHGGGFREFYAARGALGRAWIRLVMRRAERFVVLTESWRRWALSVEPRAQVAVIPNTVRLSAAARPGAATPAPAEAAPEGRAPLLFLGRIEQAKGVFVLAQALGRAHAAGARWSLVCGGTGDAPALREALKAAGVPEQAVQLPGWVDGEAKAGLLQRAELFVLPSLVENMPVSMLEAFAHAKPVIASRVGGIPDMMDDGVEGALVPPSDVDALAAALIDAWRHPGDWQRRGESACERFQRDFACDAVIGRVEALYAACLEGTRLEGCTP